MTTPYKPVIFGQGENLTKEKANQIVNNVQWLFENNPRMSYSAHGIKRATGLKIAAGIVPYIPTSNDFTANTVYFGNFFSQGCNPVVTATVSVTGKNRKTASTLGIDWGPIIDHRGFIVHTWTTDGVYVPQPHYDRTGYIHWIAVGW